MRKILYLVSLIVVYFVTVNLYALPKNVIIIRHADKIPGEIHLDQRGYERAGALPYYFSETPLYNNPPITHIFAMGIVNLGNSKESVRPIETCTPIADFYKLSMNIDFKHNQTAELAQEILTNPKYDDSTVLVCWSHHFIPQLTKALGVNQAEKWPANVFDQVYLLTYENGNQSPKFQKILQKLMFGDRPTFDSQPFPLPPTPKKQKH